MPPLPPASSMATRKRTRSTNVTENNVDHQQVAAAASNVTSTAMTSSINISSMPPNTSVVNAPPKRQRNNPPSTGPPPPVAPRTNYLLRNRSLTPDPRHPLTRFPSLNTTTTNRQRYNLRPRHPQSQIRLPQVPTPHPTVAPRRIRRPIPPTAQTLLSSSSTNIAQPLSLPIVPPTLLPPPLPPAPIPILPMNPPSTLSTPPVIQPRQYRLVYLSDEDDEPSITAQPTATLVNTTLNLITDDEDDESLRAQGARRRASRSTSNTGFNTRSRTAVTIPSSASSSSSSSSSTSTINTQEFISGVAHVRLNRAIEIVIDSIQSLEGAVNNFDQLVFGLIYGRLGTRTEFESIEGMIRLSRILNLNVPPSRLSQAEIDELPKIIFVNKTGPTSSIHLVEKCPICLTEFDDQETINKLHCTHLFHLQCISTWLSENDSCPTCRRKVMGN